MLSEYPTAEDTFISDLMPILKRYLVQKRTHLLDAQLTQIEGQLHQLYHLQNDSHLGGNHLQNDSHLGGNYLQNDSNLETGENYLNSSSTSLNLNHLRDSNWYSSLETRPRKEIKDKATEDNKESDKLVVDLTLRDLKDDVQEFISGSLGYGSIDDLLTDRPDLDGVITTLEIDIND